MKDVDGGIGEGQEEENDFHRLPDDVVLNIFDKLSDVKWLCRCFLVSKRFSSLVPLVQTLSIKTQIWKFLPISPSKSEENPQQGNGLLGKFSKFLIKTLVVKPFQYLYDLTLSPSLRLNMSLRLSMYGVVFLAKLTQIRSVDIEIPSDFIDDNDSFFKWGTNFTKLDTVTVLCATSLSKMIESEEEDETENGITQKEIHRRVSLAAECLRDVVLWVAILCHVFPSYPMLQSFTITDSKNKGMKFCLAGEKLLKCRDSFNLDKFISVVKRVKSWTRENMKVEYVPVLQLPVAGYVMKGLTIISFRLFAEDDSEDGTAMVNAFAEEQSIFSEAMVQISENRKDGSRAMFLL